jgi:hypothetical protein
VTGVQTCARPISLEQQWEKEIMAGTWDRKWVEEAIDKLV